MGLFGFGDKRTAEEIRESKESYRKKFMGLEVPETKSRFKGKVVSAKVVTCDELGGDEQAVLLILEDTTIRVRCKRGCYNCKYGQCLPNRY